MKKIMVILAALVAVLLSFGLMTVSADDTSVWDGVSADIGWYIDDVTAQTFTVSSANEWAGLVEIVAAHGANAKLYYDENGMVVTDPAKQSSDKCLTKGDELMPTSDFMKKTVLLAADIDLGGHSIKPLGYPKVFYGTLDGQNHTIRNLNTGTWCGQSMFNNDRYVYGTLLYVANGMTTAKNLTVENAVLDIVANQLVSTPSSQKRIFAGGLVGYVAGSCVTLENITVNGLTVTVRATDSATQRIYWGIFAGLNGPITKDENQIDRAPSSYKNITISDYYLAANGYDSSIFSSAKDDDGNPINDPTSVKRLFGMNQGVGTVLEGNTVTYAEHPPVITEPVTTEPPVTEPPVTEPVTTTPAETTSDVTKPVTTEEAAVTTAPATDAPTAPVEESGFDPVVMAVIAVAVVAVIGSVFLVLKKMKK